MKAPPGHLSHSALNLKQSEKVRKELSKATTAHYALKKIPQANVGWRGKAGEG